MWHDYDYQNTRSNVTKIQARSFNERSSLIELKCIHESPKSDTEELNVRKFFGKMEVERRAKERY